MNYKHLHWMTDQSMAPPSELRPTQQTQLKANAKVSMEAITKNFSDVLNQSTAEFNHTSPEEMTVVLNSLERITLESFNQNPRDQKITYTNIEIEMKTAQNSCATDLTSFLHLNVRGSRMAVPCAHLSGINDGCLFIAYTGLESRMNRNLSGSFISSKVVSATITRQNKSHLNPPIIFYMEHLKDMDPSSTPQCVFWDPDFFIWSTDGCVTGQSNITHTLCTCHHLSSFAVLMAPSMIKEDGALILLSRIGLSVSALCLFLSLLTFFLCRSLRSAHTSVLITLCGCLFWGQILFLLGIHQTWNKILCSVIAGSLHFLLLCAFCWMSLESILLFLTVRNLRAVNYMTSQRSHFPFMCLVGFGVPVIIVTISAAIRSDGYGTEKHCWLHLSLIWSFLGPVIMFITMNITLLTVTFYLLHSKLRSFNLEVSTIKNTRLLAFKALAQLVILGCTWVLGVFQLGHGAIIFSYVFVSLNSFQGAFIFLVHCLFNRQVREEYSKLLHRMHSSATKSEAASSDTTPMKLSNISSTSKQDNKEEKEHPVPEEDKSLVPQYMQLQLASKTIT